VRPSEVIKPSVRVAVLCQGRTTNQLAEAFDRRHRQSERIIRGLIDATGRAEIDTRAVGLQAGWRERPELQIAVRFKNAVIDTATPADRGIPAQDQPVRRHAMTCCCCSPNFWIPSRTVSPAFRNTGVGFLLAPTPGGVPVVMMSPGSSVMNWLV
jgi:hypothetical protein